jgi:hypothetical protein
MEFGAKDANCLYACNFFVWLRKRSPWWVGGCLGWLVGGQVWAIWIGTGILVFTCFIHLCTLRELWQPHFLPQNNNRPSCNHGFINPLPQSKNHPLHLLKFTD